MRNVDLYGIGKVYQELQKRGHELEAKAYQQKVITTEEGVARIAAWNAFAEDNIKIDDTIPKLKPIIDNYYKLGITEYEKDNLSFRCSLSEFENYFYDEIDVISKAVTNKGVQIAVRLFKIIFIVSVIYLFFKLNG